MVDKIEMSLDDIIKHDNGARRNIRSGGNRGPALNKNRRLKNGGPVRGQGNRNGALGGGVIKGRSRGGITRSKYTRGDVNSAWKHDMFDGPRKNIRSGNTGIAKIIVSNLDYGVSDTDIHELFADSGPLVSSFVHFDKSGRSLGTADVVFERRSDAVKAMKQYNGVPLDGRPMNILMATSEITSPVKPRSPRVGGPPQRRFANNRPAFNKGGLRNNNKPGFKRNGAGAAGPRRGNKPAPSAEQLDAELDAYVNDRN